LWSQELFENPFPIKAVEYTKFYRKFKDKQIGIVTIIFSISYIGGNETRKTLLNYSIFPASRRPVQLIG